MMRRYLIARTVVAVCNVLIVALLVGMVSSAALTAGGVAVGALAVVGAERVGGWLHASMSRPNPTLGKVHDGR